MKQNPTSEEELKLIRKMMEESTRFLSLSGLSGIVPGLLAIAGGLLAHFFVFGKDSLSYPEYFAGITSQQAGTLLWHLSLIAAAVLLLSLVAAVFFSFRKGKREGKSLWTPVSKRLYTSLLIPLASGALFAGLLVFSKDFEFVIPSLLVFYGLALVNAGKFTYNEIFYLGLLEIVTGLLAALAPAYGIIFWITGFGVLHVVYGLLMFRKYEA
ncbi:MAG: hypothetical protein MUD02_07090 [Bacteroidales bacterium]|nr:hypothetical protein [Bacteroidales bacterium]